MDRPAAESGEEEARSPADERAMPESVVAKRSIGNDGDGDGGGPNRGGNATRAETTSAAREARGEEDNVAPNDMRARRRLSPRGAGK